MNSVSYDKLRCISRGKFSIQQFLRLKELAANTVGVNNSIFDMMPGSKAPTIEP